MLGIPPLPFSPRGLGTGATGSSEASIGGGNVTMDHQALLTATIQQKKEGW